MANTATFYIAVHPGGKVWGAMDIDGAAPSCIIAYGNRTSIKVDHKPFGYGANTWLTKLTNQKGYERVCDPISLPASGGTTESAVRNLVEAIAHLNAGFAPAVAPLEELTRHAGNPQQVLAMIQRTRALHNLPELSELMAQVRSAIPGSQQPAAAPKPRKPKKIQGDGILAWFNGYR